MRKAQLPRQDNAVTQDVLNDLKDLITGTREDLEYQLDQVREAISTADASLHETLQSDIDQLQSSLDSIKQAQRVTDSTLPMVFIKNNEAEQDSRAFFGTDMQPQWHLNVSGNKAGRGAVVSAGAYSSETLQALLETSRTPDIAHMFRALQPQLRNAHNQPLQSILHALSVDGQQGLTGAPPKSNFPTRMTLENANTLTVLGAEHPVSSMHGVSGNEDEMHR
jgi:phage gpG-like protein